MGDLKLSHRLKEDQIKVDQLCQESKISFLKEITRTISNNQLDYILIDKELIEMCFVTSYNNFISDHNSTVLRVGLDGNEFTDEIKEVLTFDRESHLREKFVEEESLYSSSDEVNTSSDIQSIGSLPTASDEDSRLEDEEKKNPVTNEIFVRKFRNFDLTTCWLNSCLQLVLITMDHSELKESFTSELGKELLRLQKSRDYSLDSTGLKHILVTTEDTRIATRISELALEVDDPYELDQRTENVKSLRLNLLSGQQCVRDFFLCLNENFLSWPDVFLSFGFKITLHFQLSATPAAMLINLKLTRCS